MGSYTFRERLSEHPRVDIWQHGRARMAVLWLPVEDDSRATYPLKLPTTGTYYRPAPGRAAMLPARLPVTKGVAQVPLSETPVFVPLAAP